MSEGKYKYESGQALLKPWSLLGLMDRYPSGVKIRNLDDVHERTNASG